MNQEKLFACIGDLDDSLLARSEGPVRKKNKAWAVLLPAAACLCLVLGAVLGNPALWQAENPATLPGLESLPTQTQTDATERTEPTESTAQVLPDRDWTAEYNSQHLFVGADRAPIPGYFTRELDAGELAVVLPEKLLDGMYCSGTAGFDGEGRIVQVCLQVTTTLSEYPVRVVLGDDLSCCIKPASDIVSRCGDVEYAMYRGFSVDSVTVLEAYTQIECVLTLEACTQIEGVPMLFAMRAPDSDAQQAQKAFEAVLECFSWYAPGKPNLSLIAPGQIPEWFDLTLGYAEAAQDEAFGPYMLPEIPAGFAEESIRRYKDQNNNYLSSLWTKGLDELSWNIYRYTDADALRVTSVEDKKNYDLSLYPIPRADSVPAELHEIVNDPIFLAEELTAEAVWARAYRVNDAGDSDGWRMAFTVKYGDVLVHVRAKGIDPQWLYAQLKALAE